MEFEKTIKTKNFHKRIDFNLKVIEQEQNFMDQSNEITEKSNVYKENFVATNEEAFVFHSVTTILHFTQATMLDEYGNKLNSNFYWLIYCNFKLFD